MTREGYGRVERLGQEADDTVRGEKVARAQYFAIDKVMEIAATEGWKTYERREIQNSLFLLVPTPHTYTCIKELTFHSTFTCCLAAVEFNLFFIDVTTCSKKKCKLKKAINAPR